MALAEKSGSQPGHDTHPSSEGFSVNRRWQRLRATTALFLQLAPIAAGATVVGGLVAEQAWQNGAGNLPPLQWIDTNGHTQHIHTNSDGKASVVIGPHTVVTFGGENAQKTQDFALTILNSTNTAEIVPVEGQDIIAASLPDSSHNLSVFPGQENTGTPLTQDTALATTAATVTHELDTRRGHPAQSFEATVEEINTSLLPFSLLAMDQPEQIISLSAGVAPTN